MKTPASAVSQPRLKARTPMTEERKALLKKSAAEYRNKWKAIRSHPIVEFDNMRIVLLDPWNIALIDAKATPEELATGATPEEGKVIGYFGHDLRGAVIAAFRRATSSVNVRNLKELSNEIKRTEANLSKIITSEIMENLNWIMDTVANKDS